MSSKNSSSDKYRRGFLPVWFSGKIFAYYVFPVIALLGAGALLIVLQWRYVSSSTSFTEGLPSPLTYHALSPLKFTDSPATNRLKIIAEESVVGVVVRDVSAPERMKSRLNDFRLLGNRSAAARYDDVKPFPQELLNAFKDLGESRGEELLLLAEQVGGAYFETARAGARGTNEEDSALLWQEIGKLELPVGEQNLLYQLLSEVLDPGYKTDAQLTDAARGFARQSIPTVERKLNVGDVIVEQGGVVTPSLARLLRFQGYTERAFPLNQLLAACFLILLLPLWFEVSSGGPGVRPRAFGDVTWGCVVFVVVTGWVSEAAATHLNVVGAVVLPAVTMAYLCMPPRLAFIVSLGGITQGVFLITGLSLYDALFLLISGSMTSLIGYCVLRRIDSREDLGYRVLTLAVFLAILKVIIRAYQGFPITWDSLSLKWPWGDTCGKSRVSCFSTSRLRFL